MFEHNSRDDVSHFRGLPLEEKMIHYERGTIKNSLKLTMLFQELIDDGQIWQEDFPHHVHYARMCAYYLRKAACHLHNARAVPPQEAYDPHYLYQSVYEGYDTWGRAPMEVDWGRPLRWKESREVLIKEFQEKQKRKEQGLPVIPPMPPKRRGGCCGK